MRKPGAQSHIWHVSAMVIQRRTGKFHDLTFLKTRLKNEFFLPPDDFDRSHGIETRLSIWRKRLPLNSDSTGYQAIPAEVFAKAAAYLPKGRMFIDIGCGKGRTLIMAMRWTSARCGC